MNVGDMSVTFKLRKDATFQDGTPVTAKDVKWSFDRAVTVGGFPTFQMSAGSLTKPEQFVVVDDQTFRVDFITKDRLTIPDLAVIVPCVINSELVKKNATEQDPWGLEFTKLNTVGSGAYKVTNWTAGSQVVLERNDNWKGGPLPKIKRVIWRMVPDAGNRRALLERGDADVSYDLPNKDFSELKSDGKLGIVSTPYSNGIQYIGMNVAASAVRQCEAALCHRLRHSVSEDHGCGAVRPRQADVRRAGRTRPPKSPGRSRTNSTPISPRPRQLLAEAGYPNGIPEPIQISFDLGFAGVNEPTCVLVQESLAQIGIKTTINKVPGANWRTELTKKTMPLFTNVFSGWLDYPEYFFYWCYHSRQIDLQHDGLSIAGDGRLHRRRARSGRDRRHRRPTTRTSRASSISPTPTCRAFRCTSPMSTSRCRRTSAAISTGSTAGSTTALSPRDECGERDGSSRRDASAVLHLRLRASRQRRARACGYSWRRATMPTMILKASADGDSEPDRRRRSSPSC